MSGRLYTTRVWRPVGRKKVPMPTEEAFSGIVRHRIVSVSSQIVSVLRRLWKQPRLAYKRLFTEKQDKSERVAAFLALLELIHSRRVRVEGDGDEMGVCLTETGGRTVKIKEMQAQMEAILFANGDPMEVTRLSQVLEVEEGTIEKILNLLARAVRRRRKRPVPAAPGRYGSDQRASPVEPKSTGGAGFAPECAAVTGGHGSTGSDRL